MLAVSVTAVGRVEVNPSPCSWNRNLIKLPFFTGWWASENDLNLKVFVCYCLYCQIASLIIIITIVWCVKTTDLCHHQYLSVFYLLIITGSFRSADFEPCPTLTRSEKRRDYGNIWPEIHSDGGQIISIDESSMTAELINRRTSKVSSILTDKVTTATPPTTLWTLPLSSACLCITEL